MYTLQSNLNSLKRQITYRANLVNRIKRTFTPNNSEHWLLINELFYQFKDMHRIAVPDRKLEEICLTAIMRKRNEHQ